MVIFYDLHLTGGHYISEFLGERKENSWGFPESLKLQYNYSHFSDTPPTAKKPTLKFSDNVRYSLPSFHTQLYSLKDDCFPDTRIPDREAEWCLFPSLEFLRPGERRLLHAPSHAPQHFDSKHSDWLQWFSLMDK